MHVNLVLSSSLRTDCFANTSLCLLDVDSSLSISLIVKSSQVTFIYIALLTIQIVTKQLHNIKMGK